MWSDCVKFSCFLQQSSKEKISFLHMEVHELAAFILNSTGNYEAINQNCPNYFLSSESVALFAEHSSRPPPYIIGQIVHIEKRTARPLPSPASREDDRGEAICSDNNDWRASICGKSSSNPYGLSAGSEYFVVTVAMLPDTIHSTPS